SNISTIEKTEDIENIEKVEDVEKVKEEVNFKNMIEEAKKMLDEVRYTKINIRKMRREIIGDKKVKEVRNDIIENIEKVEDVEKTEDIEDIEKVEDIEDIINDNIKNSHNKINLIKSRDMKINGIVNMMSHAYDEHGCFKDDENIENDDIEYSYYFDPNIIFEDGKKSIHVNNYDVYIRSSIYKNNYKTETDAILIFREKN
ncbi:hypothetical protein, partial [Hydrotalea sp.]|uniref:hypothetical protein n=1 Tax=Hydrotalea sp. TaxID=2881279 RepID=UPI00258A73F1